MHIEKLKVVLNEEFLLRTWISSILLRNFLIPKTLCSTTCWRLRITWCKAYNCSYRSFNKLSTSDKDLLHDPFVYRRLIDQLLYLTILWPDTMFVVHKLSQFIAIPNKQPLDALRCSKSSSSLFKSFSKERYSSLES